jgi:hypothetical protein
LDKNCFRKEIIYKKDNKNYNSRIIDNIYSKDDLFEKLTNDEEDRLKDFQIYFEN